MGEENACKSSYSGCMEGEGRRERKGGGMERRGGEKGREGKKEREYCVVAQFVVVSHLSVVSPAPERKETRVAEEKTQTNTMPLKHPVASFSYTKPPVSTSA